MGCKYVSRFSFPKSAGFTGSAKAPNMAQGGKVCKASGGPITKADVQILNQALNQAARTGRFPGVK